MSKLILKEFIKWSNNSLNGLWGELFWGGDIFLKKSKFQFLYKLYYKKLKRTEKPYNSRVNYKTASFKNFIDL